MGVQGSTMHHRGRTIRGETGTAMVEFALVLPILLLLALGIVDFGRAINYWNDTNQLAGDGARFAAVNTNPGESMATPINDFREWIRSQAETGELRDGTLAGGQPSESVQQPLRVCIESPTGAPLTVGNPIRIRVESSYNLLPFIDERTQFGSVAINGSAVMRLERDYTMQTGCTS